MVNGWLSSLEGSLLDFWHNSWLRFLVGPYHPPVRLTYLGGFPGMLSYPPVGLIFLIGFPLPGLHAWLSSLASCPTHCQACFPVECRTRPPFIHLGLHGFEFPGRPCLIHLGLLGWVPWQAVQPTARLAFLVEFPGRPLLSILAYLAEFSGMPPPIYLGFTWFCLSSVAGPVLSTLAYLVESPGRHPLIHLGLPGWVPWQTTLISPVRLTNLGGFPRPLLHPLACLTYIPDWVPQQIPPAWLTFLIEFAGSRLSNPVPVWHSWLSPLVGLLLSTWLTWLSSLVCHSYPIGLSCWTSWRAPYYPP